MIEPLYGGGADGATTGRARTPVRLIERHPVHHGIGSIRMKLFDLLTSLDDLDGLVKSDQRESETLEYKTAPRPLTQSDYKEIAKDVSAFANSSGGLLIYGIATDVRDTTKPTGREPIAEGVVNVVLQVVATHIRHPISGIRSKTLPVGQPAQALLIEVPQSSLAPHQVLKDHRYYRRHGAHNEPMTHDLLELYFGRRLGPLLEPRFDMQTLSEPAADEKLADVRIRCRARNMGQGIARDVTFLGTSAYDPDLDIAVELPKEASFNQISDDARSFGAHLSSRVLHAELESLLLICRLRASGIFAAGALPLFFFSLHADRMTAVRGRVYLRRTDAGLYTLEMTREDGELWDGVSQQGNGIFT